MIAVEKARQQLLDLGLSQAASILDSRLEAASQKDLTYADFLTDLLDTELAARRERYITARTRLAHLPFHKTLDQFDFSFQPSIDERQVRELATLTFVQEASNIMFCWYSLQIAKERSISCFFRSASRCNLLMPSKPSVSVSKGFFASIGGFIFPLAFLRL